MLLHICIINNYSFFTFEINNLIQKYVLYLIILIIFVWIKKNTFLKEITYLIHKNFP